MTTRASTASCEAYLAPKSTLLKPCQVSVKQCILVYGHLVCPAHRAIAQSWSKVGTTNQLTSSSLKSKSRKKSSKDSTKKQRSRHQDSPSDSKRHDTRASSVKSSKVSTSMKARSVRTTHKKRESFRSPERTSQQRFMQTSKSHPIIIPTVTQPAINIVDTSVMPGLLKKQSEKKRPFVATAPQHLAHLSHLTHHTVQGISQANTSTTTICNDNNIDKSCGNIDNIDNDVVDEDELAENSSADLSDVAPLSCGETDADCSVGFEVPDAASRIISTSSIKSQRRSGTKRMMARLRLDTTQPNGLAAMPDTVLVSGKSARSSRNRKTPSSHTPQKKQKVIKAISQPPAIHVEHTVHLDPGKGRNGKMEDCANVVELHILNPCLPGLSLLGMVFDGHGGKACSAFCVSNFASILEQVFHETIPASTTSTGLDTTKTKRHSKRNAAATAAVVPTTTYRITHPGRALYDAVGILCTEWDKHSRVHADRSGSTMSASLIHPASGAQWLINLGDSRGVVMTTATGEVVFQTKDHKPDSPIEIERVSRRSIEISRVSKGKRSLSITHDAGDVPRVNGQLAMTRAIGDNGGRLLGVVDREPDIWLIPTIHEPYVTVIASDGVWDVMSSEAMGTFCHDMYKQGQLNATQVIERVKNDKLCADNISAVVMQITQNV